MTDADRFAAEGQIWICHACGRSGKDRYGLRDVSCAMNAVLCTEASIERDEAGRIVRAEAVAQARVEL